MLLTFYVHATSGYVHAYMHKQYENITMSV